MIHRIWTELHWYFVFCRFQSQIRVLCGSSAEAHHI